MPDRAPIPLPKPQPRYFSIPHRILAEPVQLVRQPALIDAPVIQSAPAQALQPLLPILAAPPLPRFNAPVEPPSHVVRIAGFESRTLPQDKPERTVTAPSGLGFEGVVAPQKSSTEPKRAESTGGFGAAAIQASGPSRSAAVSPGAFGSSPAGVSGQARPQQQTARSGFEDSVAAQNPAPIPHPETPESFDSTPVEITSKPRPAYTDEARHLHIEGEILIEVVFKASGEIEIVRIIRGLGHGLNESAIAAARVIHFRPAREHGRPIDSTATVRISFELAY